MYYVASSLASRDGTHAHCSMNIKYSVYSRAATITPDGHYVRRLFEGGYYSKYGVYSRKYGILGTKYGFGPSVDFAAYAQTSDPPSVQYS